MRIFWQMIFQVLIFLGSFIVSLIIAELGLRIISTQTNIYTIEMLKYAKELKSRDPLGIVSHIHIPNKSAHLMGVDISLNSYGNRGYEIPNTTKKLNKVLVLGGSGTLGWGVPFEQVFTTLVENRLNHEKPFGEEYSFYFANAGIGNYVLNDFLAILDRQLNKIRPDLVVLHFGLGIALPKISEGQSPMVIRNSYALAFLYEKVLSNILVYVSRKTVSNNSLEFFRGENAPWKKSLKLIVDTRNQLEKQNIKFLIMFYPEARNLAKDSPYQPLYKNVLNDFEVNHLDVLNLIPLIQERYAGREELLYVQKDDFHPNKSCHQLQADALYKFIVEADPLRLNK